MIQNTKGLGKTTERDPENRVLQPNFKTSQNFYASDHILLHLIKRDFTEEGIFYMDDKLDRLGKEAAGRMNDLSLEADKNGPRLVKRDKYGETIDHIKFHPAYEELLKIAVRSEMFRVKWEPELRRRFRNERHSLGFASGYLYSLSECGLYCPLCMTDGVARLIDRYADDEDKARLLKHIYTDNPEELYTGAMFLTEKAGGSDVGANLVSATHKVGKYYLLNGEKWFCSNANAKIIFALARTNPEVKGTKGLSIFMIGKQRPDGSKNPMDIVRLKDKLGVRSMASAECILTNTWGKLICEEGKGFKIMTDMVNLSRLYNAVSAIANSRRALIEAYQFLKFRKSFGKIALDHALVRHKLTELGTINMANFYLTWRAIKALDLADNGNGREAQLLRFLTPMVKKVTAEDGVYSIRESMELMGGIGYIEDTVMPKIMRDAMVLPIWEGAGNIMVLDMLRASAKLKGLKVMGEEIIKLAENAGDKGTVFTNEWKTIMSIAGKLESADQDTMELSAKLLFERLTRLYQAALLLGYRDEESKKWIDPAFDFLVEKLSSGKMELRQPLSREKVEAMLAWDF